MSNKGKAVDVLGYVGLGLASFGSALIARDVGVGMVVAGAALLVVAILGAILR